MAGGRNCMVFNVPSKTKTVIWFCDWGLCWASTHCSSCPCCDMLLVVVGSCALILKCSELVWGWALPGWSMCHWTGSLCSILSWTSPGSSVADKNTGMDYQSFRKKMPIYIPPAPNKKVSRMSPESGKRGSSGDCIVEQGLFKSLRVVLSLFV